MQWGTPASWINTLQLPHSTQAISEWFKVDDKTDPYTSVIHRAALPLFPEGTTYRVGSDCCGWSELHTVASSAKLAGEVGIVRFLAVADLSADINDGGYGV